MKHYVMIAAVGFDFFFPFYVTTWADELQIQTFFFSYTNTVLGYSGDSILNELKFLVVLFFSPGGF
jgi:hypothetical protein